MLKIMALRASKTFELSPKKIFINIPLMIIVNAISPIIMAVFILVFLMVIDLILGIMRAIKSKRFSSARLRTGANKFLLYTLGILAIRFGEMQIPHVETIMATEFFILFLSVTELVSILETLAILGVNIPSPVLQFFKKQTDIKKITDMY